MGGDGFSTFYELVAEAKRIKALQTITKYRGELVEAAVLHTKMLYSELQDIMGSNDDETEHVQVSVAALMHYTIAQQLKRAVLVYLRTRMDVIMNCLWDLGGAGTASAVKLISEFEENLSEQESEFIRSYTFIIGNYKGEYMELDIGGLLKPPRELYVEVRVLQNCGEIVTCTGPVRLSKDSQHYLKRSDIESLISAGYLKHVG